MLWTEGHCPAPGEILISSPVRLDPQGRSPLKSGKENVSSVSALLSFVDHFFHSVFCCFPLLTRSLSLYKLEEHLSPTPQPQNKICIPKYLCARVSLGGYPELYHFSEHITVCLKMGGKGLKNSVPWRCFISVQTPGVGIGATGS